jgi:4-amino-4-deoxy-L-arabinose transferase-like glycosyltransferase
LSIDQNTALSIFILFCTGLSSALIFLLASQAFDLRTGVISALLWITYPFQLWLTKQPNSEIPFMVLFFASVLLFWRGRSLPTHHWTSDLGAGLLAGLAALIRPIAIGVGLVFAGFLLVQRSVRTRTRLASTFVLLASYLLVLLPWEGWVYARLQQVILLSSGGELSVWDGLTYAVEGDYQAEGWVPRRANDLMLDILNRESELSTQSISGMFILLGQEAVQNPLGALQFFGLKAARSWYGTESGRLETLNMALQSVYLLAVIWGGLIVWQIGNGQKRYLIFILVLGLYFWLMTVLVLSIMRYMVPMMGLLMPLIAIGVLKFPRIRSVVDRLLPLQLQ